MSAPASSILRQRIAEWMESTIQTRGYERFADLHVDTVVGGACEPSTWLGHGFRLLHLAEELRDLRHPSYAVALGCSLRSGVTPLGLNFHDRATLQREFDWSPPSLYLFPRGDLTWLGPGEAVELSQGVLEDLRMEGRIFLREWHEPSDQEYRRALWVVR